LGEVHLVDVPGADVVLGAADEERKSGRERVDVMWGEWRVAVA